MSFPVLPSRVPFQSTLPYGSDSNCARTVDESVSFQSTLPYGSDHLHAIVWDGRQISIHAPVWERPPRYWYYFVQSVISIHAPVWERLEEIDLDLTSIAFQSTLPYGSDMSCGSK